MGNKKLMKVSLVAAAGIAVVLGAGYSFLRLVGILTPDACISEGMKTVPSLSGAKVEVIYTNCDTLIKDETVNVYVSATETKEDLWLTKWLRGRTLVFSYDPGRDNRPPVIESPAKDKVLISVSGVSQVFVQRRKWRGVSIYYSIGRVMNP
jgi:hypothetical protein